jgi:hypothetical protein
MQEQELFNSYEVKNWDFNPRIYKILAVSAIFNVLALVIFAQTNLLTTKGCDSPLVGGVCKVLDALVVGGNVLTTNAGYIESGDDYVATVLTEDDEITFINVADKLIYPEGYFALSNPEKYAQPNPNDPMNFGNSNGFDTSGFPNSNPTTTLPNPTTGKGGGGGVLAKSPVLPKPRKGGVVKGRLPDDFDNPTVAKPEKTPKPAPEQKEAADNDANKNKDENKNPIKSEPVDGIVIDKTPMKKFAADTKVKYDKKEVDLTKNFRIDAVGVITKEGKLDVTEDKKTKQKKSRIIKSEGDEKMVEVAKQALEAVGDSGWLTYLRNEGIEKFNFTIIQDDQQLVVLITSEQPTPDRAKTVASKLNVVIQAAQLADRNGLKKLGDDERLLLNSAKLGANGNQFVLNFTLPKAVAQEMITRKLNEPEKTEEKPNSTAKVIEKTEKTGK